MEGCKQNIRTSIHRHPKGTHVKVKSNNKPSKTSNGRHFEFLFPYAFDRPLYFWNFNGFTASSPSGQYHSFCIWTSHQATSTSTPQFLSDTLAIKRTPVTPCALHAFHQTLQASDNFQASGVVLSYHTRFQTEPNAYVETCLCHSMVYVLQRRQSN